MVDVYSLHDDIYIDLWLRGGNRNLLIENLLYSGKLSRMLECDVFCWQPKPLERVFSEAVKLREEAEACKVI